MPQNEVRGLHDVCGWGVNGVTVNHSPNIERIYIQVSTYSVLIVCYIIMTVRLCWYSEQVVFDSLFHQIIIVHAHLH